MKSGNCDGLQSGSCATASHIDWKDDGSAALTGAPASNRNPNVSAQIVFIPISTLQVFLPGGYIESVAALRQGSQRAGRRHRHRGRGAHQRRDARRRGRAVLHGGRGQVLLGVPGGGVQRHGRQQRRCRQHQRLRPVQARPCRRRRLAARIAVSSRGGAKFSTIDSRHQPANGRDLCSHLFG